MCLAIPARIIEIEDNVYSTDRMATVELAAIRCQVSLVLTPEAQMGDYVIVHAGFALSVLDEEEAQETLEIFRAMEEMTRSP